MVHIPTSRRPTYVRRVISGLGLCLGVALLVATSRAPAAAGPNCQCRYFGKFYTLGKSVCIRGRVATCTLVLNNSSWNFSQRRCEPVAGRPDTLGLIDQSLAVTAQSTRRQDH